MQKNVGFLLALAAFARAASPTAQEARPPKGLLGIAEAEANRTARVLREKILGALRTYALQHETASDRGKEQLDLIVQNGADAAPILVEVLRDIAGGTKDSAWAGPASRALAAIFDRTKNAAIMKSLADVARSGNAIVRAGVLEGLESLDHPMAIEIVAPLLQEQDAALQAQVVRVLGRQKSSSESVSRLLLPLLKQEGAPAAETLMALLQLGDRGGVEAAQTWLAKSADPALLGVAIRYLSELGGKNSLPALRGLLVTHGAQGLPDALLKRAVDAVQRIGLREVEAKKPAEELLVDVFKKHPAFAVRDWARWQLGPYQNDEALKSLEAPVLDSIKNDRSGRGVADLWIELADDRLQFEQWGKAAEALNKAQAEDDKGFRIDRIEPKRAVALCGLQKFAAAEKILRGLPAEEREKLLEKHPVIERMGKDPAFREKFRELFPSAAPAK